MTTKSDERRRESSAVAREREGPTEERGCRTGRETLSATRTAGDGFRRGLTATCQRAWLYPGSHRVLPASTGRADFGRGCVLVRRPSVGDSRAFTGVAVAGWREPAEAGVPSCSRTPLARGPVLGLRPPPPRRRCAGSVRFSFGTWAFSPVPGASASAPITPRFGCRRSGTRRPCAATPSVGIVNVRHGGT